MTTAPKEYKAEVRNQYEEMPYPARDPLTARVDWFGNECYSLDAFSHVGWSGKRDMRVNTRYLSAGCGTGDNIIFWAEQLRGHDSAEIVALDFSATSLDIAKRRIAQRGLTNVKFVHASILDLPKLGLGTFDVIESTGVLHHLADPNAGLAALRDVLNPDGIMFTMVYALYGRYPVYMVQELMKRMNVSALPATEQVELCRGFLNDVPKNHWLLSNYEYFLGDIQDASGAGIYDLFLHSTDRAYSVPQIYEWLDGAGLNLVQFVGWLVSQLAYEPEYYTKNPKLMAQLAGLPARERHAIAELMHGTMSKHSFYSSKQPKTLPALAEDMVPTYGTSISMPHDFASSVCAVLDTLPDNHVVNIDSRIPLAPPITIRKFGLTSPILAAIDGNRSVGDILLHLAAQGSINTSNRDDLKRFTHDMRCLFEDLHSRTRMYLRHQSIAPYITSKEIVARLDSFPPISLS